MEFLTQYGLFLAKAVTFVAAILIIIAAIGGLIMRQKSASENKIEVKKLNTHFHRMGLLFDGEKWSLNGVSLHNQIKTIRSTRVWNQIGEAMIVPVHTVLGQFEAAKNGITRFKTLDGKTLFVNTPMISYV